MSYILKALKKSQQQRELGQVPTLKTSLDPLPDSPRKGRLLPILSVALVSIVVGAGAVWAWKQWPLDMDSLAFTKGGEEAPVRASDSAARDSGVAQSAGASLPTQPVPPQPAATQDDRNQERSQGQQLAAQTGGQADGTSSSATAAASTSLIQSLSQPERSPDFVAAPEEAPAAEESEAARENSLSEESGSEDNRTEGVSVARNAESEAVPSEAQAAADVAVDGSGASVAETAAALEPAAQEDETQVAVPATTSQVAAQDVPDPAAVQDGAIEDGAAQDVPVQEVASLPPPSAEEDAGVQPLARPPKAKPLVLLDPPSYPPTPEPERPAQSAAAENQVAAIQPPSGDETAVTEETSAAPAPVDSEFHSVPHFKSMPRHFQLSVPEMKITLHVYDAIPARRFVRINRQKYFEGEQVASGLTLDAITPDGLVMSYDGQQFWIESL